MQAPRKLVAAVRVDGLEQAESDPYVYRQDVQVASDGAPEDGRTDGWDSEKHDFDRRSVLSGETEWCGVLVVNFVDVLIEGTPMEGTVQPIVSKVFHYEEKGNLAGHCEEGREWNPGFHTKIMCHWVEEPVSCQ